MDKGKLISLARKYQTQVTGGFAKWKMQLRDGNGKMRPLWWLIATWFAAGMARKAPGTTGSLAALPFAYILHITLGSFGLLFASLLMFVIGWWATKKFMAQQPEQGNDPQSVVVDEVAGQWLVLSVLYPTFTSYVVGFLLFRVFDIIKPWPVCWADKNVKGPVGVMFDDFLAAMYPVMIYLMLMLEAQLVGNPQLLVPLVSFLGG
jgi:phosphatidylglycerophosphatase A